jgi:hypothetical protein
MILLNNENIKDPKKLKERKEYVQKLLDEGFPQVSPSSEEWTSSEFQAGHTSMLRQEIRDIDAALKTLYEHKSRRS